MASGARAASPLCARMALMGIHVEDQGQIRFSPDNQIMQPVNERAQIAACGALINSGAISEAIAEHDLITFESGLNDPFHVIAPGGCKEKRLSLG